MNYPPEIRQMVTLCLITAFTLGVTSAVAIEHPVYRRYSRSHDVGHVHVTARPKFVEIREGETITIRCRAKGGLYAEDTPYVTFYRKLDDKTVMPLGSSSYGVTIEAAPGSAAHSRFQKSVKLLHLEKETYDLLEKGDNVFYCRGSRLDGASGIAYFVVRKV